MRISVRAATPRAACDVRLWPTGYDATCTCKFVEQRRHEEDREGRERERERTCDEGGDTESFEFFDARLKCHWRKRAACGPPRKAVYFVSHTITLPREEHDRIAPILCLLPNHGLSSIARAHTFVSYE